MTRFLRYAMEHGRKIRAVFMMDGRMVQKTVSVLGYDQSVATFQIGAKKTLTLSMEDIFSCDYARGDHGED